MTTPTDPKSLSQERFGEFATAYLTSTPHVEGEDLTKLFAMASPQPDWVVLDIATGGGHTANMIAPHVKLMVAGDITYKMLRAAQTLLSKHDNTTYTATDAENMAFAPNSFDLITCRIAPHHFPNCFRFIQECARILKPNGKLVIEDHYVPENDHAARYIDAFEQLRDPSHHRIYAEYEWRGMYLDAGLVVDETFLMHKSSGGFLDWVNRQKCTPETIEKLEVMLIQAPQDVKDFLHPRAIGTPEADFDHSYIIIGGHKPA